MSSMRSPNNITVKICGLSEENTLQAAVDHGAGLVGFVHFPKSPRHVSIERAAQLKQLLPAHVQSVLVIVDPDDALLTAIQQILTPDYIQLHGKETPDRVADIRRRYPGQKLIKAISVSSSADLKQAHHYESHVDMLMFDAKAPAGSDLPGGNGVSFDWHIMHGFSCAKPWMLSGGLTPENVAQAIRESGARYVDVSSGVESGHGIKNIAKIARFMAAARNAA